MSRGGRSTPKVMQMYALHEATSNGETQLLPRRPRTPLRIGRDLAHIVKAQAQQQVPLVSPTALDFSGANKKTSAHYKSTRPTALRTTVVNFSDEEVDKDPDREREAESESEQKHSDTDTQKRQTQKLLVKRSKTPRGRFWTDTPQHIASTRAKAREPTETQRLNDDLKLLAVAVSADASRHGKKTGALDVGNSNQSRLPTSPASRRKSRKASVVWDRPWRSPPKGARGSVQPGSTRASVRGSTVRASMSPRMTNLLKAGDAAESPEARAADAEKIKQSDQASQKLFWKVSADLKIPMDVIKSAFGIFKVHASKSADAASQQDVTDMVLTKVAFGEVLLQLTGSESVEDVPKELRSTVASASEVGSEGRTFKEFVLWYSSHGFSDEVMLTKQQREIREVVRKFQMKMSPAEIERMKVTFDQFDLDGGGTIDSGEFEKMLHTMLKVPAHLELPSARVKTFWTEIDSDNSGEIDFEEFLVFYSKLFHSEDGETTSPLETFYRGLRSTTKDSSNTGEARQPKTLDHAQGSRPGPTSRMNSLQSVSEGSRRTRENGNGRRPSVHTPNFFPE